MAILPAKRVRSIGGYAFAEVEQQVENLRARGITPIDFGVGDPTTPTPALIREACKRGVDTHAATGYPSYVGSASFRDAAVGWMKSRFGVSLDPQTELISSIGSKEAVFHFAEAFVDPGDVVLCPSPGYPPYKRGALFAEGTPYFYPLSAENNFLPDLDAIPPEVARAAKILWLNYPNSPSGVTAPPAFYDRAITYCRKHGIILASDEAYSEIYFGEKPSSILEFAREGVVAFFSLSKRSAMTGYRIGWVAGDAEIIGAMAKVKTNVDSGTPNFVQEAAIAALADEKHVQEMREEYRQKRDIMIEALKAVGLPDCTPESTLYIWQRVPQGLDGKDLALRLLAPEVAVVVTPGPWISDVCGGDLNPGLNYVRFALVPSLEATCLAAERIKALDFS